jgi:hypothetical protein
MRPAFQISGSPPLTVAHYLSAGNSSQEPNILGLFEVLAIGFAKIGRQRPSLKARAEDIAVHETRYDSVRKVRQPGRGENGPTAYHPVTGSLEVFLYFRITNWPRWDLQIRTFGKIYGIKGYATAAPDDGGPAYLTADGQGKRGMPPMVPFGGLG